jgi:NAD(P)-dependent dehydrogenase (short-subunit alcohol dehydrogenase family)
VYAATKWGMNGWSESLRRELLPDVRVMLIEPGVVATELPKATHLLVSARTSGERRDLDGISLFLVPFDAAVPSAGVRVHPFRTIDGREAADLEFDGLRLPADALLGAEDRAWDPLARALDEATAAVAAEAVGCMRKVLADTVEYTKNRRQFGQPIAGFQVLQHRMVDMYIEVEQSVAAVYLATMRLGAAPAERARAVSAAKVTIGRAARMIGQNAVQLHGGMGMTRSCLSGTTSPGSPRSSTSSVPLTSTSPATPRWQARPLSSNRSSVCRGGCRVDRLDPAAVKARATLHHGL